MREELTVDNVVEYLRKCDAEGTWPVIGSNDTRLLLEHIDALRAAQQATVPDDVARDAERYRWLRDYATEHLYGDELISLFDRHSSAFDAGIDAAMLAAKAKGGVA